LASEVANRNYQQPRYEIRALRELRRQFPDSAFVFATERGGPFTADAVNRLIKRIGKRAGFPFQVHAHMLRHALSNGTLPSVKIGRVTAGVRGTSVPMECSSAPRPPAFSLSLSLLRCSFARSQRWSLRCM
jgi:integrase-like protein